MTYDAIVIGSGMSGAWAAKELCDKGYKTLVLERGRDVQHVTDYPTAQMNPWEFPFRTRLMAETLQANPIVGRCYAFNDATEHFFVKDNDHPYIQEKPFDWIRAYQSGGKSLLWARQTQRWSKYEFLAPERDGFAVPWPIGYDDVAPWYSYVEKFVGISGNRDGLPHMPDSESLPAFGFNCAEEYIRDGIKAKFPDRAMFMGRCAHLTQPQEIHLRQGRGQCQARSLCERGCPYGGYFTSVSSTLPWARKTGHMTLRPHSVVHSIIYDDRLGKAAGVRMVDAGTKQMIEYYAQVIFVNAACLNTNLILLNSVSSRFPNGLGNDSGTLGRYVAFHNYRGKVNAILEGFEDKYYSGRRPTQVFMPSFRNVFKQDTDFIGRYMTAWGAGRAGWGRGTWDDSVGAGLKEEMKKPGIWHVNMMMQGETIPRYENHVRLSGDQKDEFGIPQLITSIGYDDNDKKLMNDFLEQGVAMLEAAGCRNVRPHDTGQAPGLDIHEMGGVRMGKDPRTSMLNRWNQLHACKNVFVTDGAAFTSVGYQNPSLTFMALTARAANYAAEEMRKGNL